MPRIFYAGTDEDEFYNLSCEQGVDAQLVSFYKMRKWPALLRKRKEEHPEVDFFVDSGAYTFQREKGQELTLDDYELYAEEYTKYLETNIDCIFAAAELDVEQVVGLERVYRWQRELFAPLEDRIPIVYVWHPFRGPDGWTEMCKQHEYVGFSRDVSHEERVRLLATARKYLTKVHGFGITDSTSLRTLNCYSVDSLTWKTCEMYGTTYYWDGSTLKVFDKTQKDQRRRFRGQFETLGLDWAAIENDERREITRASLMAFRLMEFAMERRAVMVPFWEYRVPPRELSPEDISKWAEKFGWKNAEFDDSEEDKFYVSLVQAVQNNWGLEDYDPEDLAEGLGWLLKSHGKVTSDPHDAAIYDKIRVKMNDCLVPKKTFAVPRTSNEVFLDRFPKPRARSLEPTDYNTLDWREVDKNMAAALDAGVRETMEDSDGLF